MLAAAGLAFRYPISGETLQQHAAPEASFRQVLSIFGEALPPLDAP